MDKKKFRKVVGELLNNLFIFFLMALAFVLVIFMPSFFNYENKMIIKNFCEDQGWIVHNDNSCQRYFNNITVVVKEVVVINKTAYWIN